MYKVPNYQPALKRAQKRRRPQKQDVFAKNLSKSTIIQHGPGYVLGSTAFQRLIKQSLEEPCQEGTEGPDNFCPGDQKGQWA